MQEIPIEQGLASARCADKSVQTPLIPNDANFKKESRIRVLSSLAITLSQMEPSLFGSSATIRTKQGFEGERAHSGQWMIFYKQRIVDAV